MRLALTGGATGIGAATVARLRADGLPFLLASFVSVSLFVMWSFFVVERRVALRWHGLWPHFRMMSPSSQCTTRPVRS